MAQGAYFKFGVASGLSVPLELAKALQLELGEHFTISVDRQDGRKRIIYESVSDRTTEWADEEYELAAW